MRFYTTYASPIGTLWIEIADNALTGIWITGQKHFPGDLTSRASENFDHPLLTEVTNWLKEYFNGGRPDPTIIELAPEGSYFQKSVWKLLLAIPYGQTVTYGALATAIGKPNACQAVGNAVGKNPISILIPCHRVLGASGSLTGYAGGIINKQFLLKLEHE